MYIRIIFAFMAIINLTSIAIAQQWAPVGDAGLRNDVELLKSYDIIEGPVNTWPISWKQITAGINIDGAQSYPGHVMRAIDRVRRKIPSKGFRGSVIARYTNEPSLVRGFGDAARSDADLSASVGITEENFEANVNVNYRNNVTNNHVNFDNSYIAAHLGNWSLYAGAIDRWWGPGQDNTLLLSSNARPMMSAGLRRNDPKAFKSKWLSWIGPWTWDMFVGNMGNKRVIPDALIAGMRLGFEPANNLEIGFSRTLQLCGQERPCDFNTWTDAFIVVGDRDNTGSENEPGNQLASIDLSYSINFGEQSLKLYAEGTAEDEVILPTQYGRLVGATFVAPIDENGGNLSINLELSDTSAIKYFFFGKRYPRSLYNHRLYKTGHRFDSRTIGHSFDTNSKLASLTTVYTRASGDTYRVSFRAGTLNFDNVIGNIVSAQSQKYQSVELSASKAFDFGQLELEIAMQTRTVTLTQGTLPRLAGGLTWRKSI